MNENDIIEMYFATILVGDEYHQAGEEIRISEFDLEGIRNKGLRLRIENPEFRDDIGVWHWYPVAIRKKVYRLDLIEVDTLEGGDRSNRPSWENVIEKVVIDYGGSRCN